MICAICTQVAGSHLRVFNAYDACLFGSSPAKMSDNHTSTSDADPFNGVIHQVAKPVCVCECVCVCVSACVYVPVCVCACV